MAMAGSVLLSSSCSLASLGQLIVIVNISSQTSQRCCTPKVGPSDSCSTRYFIDSSKNPSNHPSECPEARIVAFHDIAFSSGAEAQSNCPINCKLAGCRVSD